MNATIRPRPWRARRGRGRGCAAAPLGVALLLAVAAAARGETLDEYLASGELQNITNPIPINYFLEQAPASLSEADRARAMEQINLALRRQTNALNNMLASINGAFNGTLTQQTMQQAAQQMSWGNLLKQQVLGHFGVNAAGPTPTQRQSQAMEEEMHQGMADPWIRGIESARALERLGDVQAAARFYMNCIQSLPPDWLPENCLNEILAMGTARAHALLTWVAANAESAGLSNPNPSGRKSGAGDEVVWLRGAALRGLGVLAGSGQLTPEQHEAALQPILTYAQGKEHSAYYSAAAAALGSARDPRGLSPLHELAGYKKDPRVEEAALRSLAVDFHRDDALRKLRGRLDDKSADVQFAAADALLAAGDEAVYAWAREIVTSRRAPDATTVDLRPRVVRTLVAHRDTRSQQTLQDILHQGAGNDWLNAWVAVGLLEMGDNTQFEAVRAAIRKNDWGLDRPTLGSAWRAIKPYVQLAMNAAVGAPVSAQQIAQVIGNMAFAARNAAIERANDREVASLQLRFEACEAFAAREDAAATAELTALIADPQPAVRLSAARSLALQPGSGSLEGLVAAYHADFGAEEGKSRTPEVRAALLRAALNRAPGDPYTRALVQEAAAAADPGIRFVGLVAATNAAHP
jgi:HEAT repeat protein